MPCPELPNNNTLFILCRARKDLPGIVKIVRFMKNIVADIIYNVCLATALAIFPAMAIAADVDNTPLEIIDAYISYSEQGVQKQLPLYNNCELEQIPEQSVIYIKNNKYADAEQRALEVTLYDVTNAEEYIWGSWTYEMGVTADYTEIRNGKNADGYFEFPSSLSHELTLGHLYELRITAYNWIHGVPQEERVYRGQTRIFINGMRPGYPYSKADILSITPAPNSLIDSADENVITITYSYPVEIIQFNPQGKQITGSSHGSAGWVSFERLEHNPDKTVWKLTLPRHELESSVAGLNICIAAQDMDGNRVRLEDYTQPGIYNMGEKDNSTQSITLYSYLGCRKLNVMPRTGTVQSLYSFDFRTTVTSGLGQNLQYQGIDPQGHRIYPQLLSNSGAVVADMVYKYEEVEEETAMVGKEEIVKRVTMHLDREITNPGRYILHIPAMSFVTGSGMSSQMNAPQNIEYIIDGDYAVDACSLRENQEVGELDIVSFYVQGDVALSNNAFATIRRADSGIIICRAPLMIADCGSYSRIDADFSIRDAVIMPYIFNPRVDGTQYIMCLEKGAILSKEGSPYAAMDIKLRYPEDKIAETVTVKTIFNAKQTTHKKVVAGEKFTLNLEMPQWWELLKLSVNGTDVTDDVSAQSYTTTVTGDTDIEVETFFNGVYTVSPHSGEIQIFNTPYTFKIKDQNLIVDGLKDGDNIKIYSIKADLMMEKTAETSAVKIGVDKDEYVVVINDDYAVRVFPGN